MSVASGFPRVAGHCPTCRSSSLFLGKGGHVTCARLDCASPCAADDLLYSFRPDFTPSPVSPSGESRTPCADGPCTLSSPGCAGPSLQEPEQ